VATSPNPDASSIDSPHPRVAGYRVLERLGGSSSASVWKAVREASGREVALKLFTRVNDKDAERFLREATSAKRIQHPHVATCQDAGQSGRHLWVAMDLVSGGDAAALAERKGGKLDEDTALAIIRDAASGLEALAAESLVHRDLKPANILISADGTAKIANLGLNRSQAADETVTKQGAVFGTPAFMSPEQARGDREVDLRSDLYSLGATLFALVVGRLPFDGPNPWVVLAKVLSEPAPDPRLLAPKLSAEVRTIIRCAMARSPDARYQAPAQMREDCESVLAGGRAHNAGLIRQQPSAARAGSGTVHYGSVRTTLGVTVASDGLTVSPAPPWAWWRFAIVALALLGGLVAGAPWLRPATIVPTALTEARKVNTAAAWQHCLEAHPQDAAGDEARAMLALHAWADARFAATEAGITHHRRLDDSERERRKVEEETAAVRAQAAARRVQPVPPLAPNTPPPPGPPASP